MEAKQLGSNKRKRSSFSSNPFAVILTRSKSQIFVHRSRSGRRRPDSVHRDNPLTRFQSMEPLSRHKQLKTTSGHPEHLADGGHCGVGDASQILIKDLRVRRIFSLSADRDVGETSDGKERIENGGSRKARRTKGTNPNLSSMDENTGTGNRLNGRRVAGVGVLEEFDREVSVEDPNFSSNTNEKIPDEVFNFIEDECAQATPPDPEIVAKLQKEKPSSGVPASVPVNPSNVGAKKSEGHAVECLGTQFDKGSGSISRNKRALNQRYRLKLFKPVGSFSYKRLLPYLMNMENDSSSLPGDPNIDKSLLGDKLFEEKSADQSLATSKLKTSVDTFNAGNSAEDYHASDSGSNGLLDGSEEHLTSMEIVTGSPIPIGSSVCSLVSADDGSCLKTPKNGGTEAFDKDQPNVTDTANINTFNTRQKGDDEDIKGGLIEELQFTPPDGTIGAKPKVDITESSIAECALLSSESSLQKSSNGSISRPDSLVHDKRNQSSFKSKSVLNQCSRQKIFRSPGSFSYRRLLPYLMDVAKENSCASVNNSFPKMMGCLEERPPQALVDSDCKKTPTDNSSGTPCHAEQHPGHSDAMPGATFIAASGSTNNAELNVTSPVNIKGSAISFDMEGALHEFKDFKSDADPKLETVTNITLSICGNNRPSSVTLCSLVSHGSSSLEGANLTSQPSSLKTEEGGTGSLGPAEATRLLHSSCFEMSAPPLRNSSAGSQKGILKRNPRGCRGLCTCLNCSSFRLNAEMAFEFSRNQMQNTEELTLDLINELAYLRNILEKSSRAGVWMNQVKEACRKASEAEEVAEQRLGQMKDDLDIHCRITCSQRPRVRFAENLRKRCFPNAELPSLSGKIAEEKKICYPSECKQAFLNSDS